MRHPDRWPGPGNAVEGRRECCRQSCPSGLPAVVFHARVPRGQAPARLGRRTDWPGSRPGPNRTRGGRTGRRRRPSPICCDACADLRRALTRCCPWPRRRRPMRRPGRSQWAGLRNREYHRSRTTCRGAPGLAGSAHLQGTVKHRTPARRAHMRHLQRQLSAAAHLIPA